MRKYKMNLRNGETIIISQSVANILNKNICSGTAKDIQCFEDENGNTFLIVRISEIISIS